MRTSILALSLAACGGPALDLPVPDGPTADQAAPPLGSLPTLRLSAWRSGDPIRARVTGAPVGANAFVLSNTQGPGVGPCHPTAGICAGLVAPFSVSATGTVDGTGTVELGFVPAGPEPQWIQVALIAPGGGGYAMPVELRVQDDADGDWVLDAVDNCPDTPNSAQFDDDGDGWGSGCDCDDADPAIYPGGPDTPGDFIDGDCDGVDAGTTLDSFAGTYTGTADLQLGGDLLNLSAAGISSLPCTGSVTVVVDPAATPQIVGGGSCATSLYGISGPAYPFSFEGDLRFRPSGDFDFLGAVGDWSGAFGFDGTNTQLVVEPDLNAYGLTLTGTMALSF
jgi:hypothetical protein